MAGDWIKVETGTPNKPELRHLARTCGVSQAEAFLAWFRLWVYFDRHVDESGFLAFCTAEDCDQEAGLPGTCNALSVTGWLHVDETGVTIRNWQRHNGRSAKQRAQVKNRVSKHRTRVQDM